MVVSMKMAVFWVVVPRRAITMMMEAANTSEMSVIFCQTIRRHIPEDSHLQYYSITPNQRLLTCGTRTPGDLRLFRKLNNFSQQIYKVFYIKKAKSEIENFKTLCKSEGI
jgi:hypothetical protein